MEGLKAKLGELESRKLGLVEFIEQYIGLVDSYLGRFGQDERYRAYQNLIAELGKTPKSERAELAFVYID